MTMVCLVCEQEEIFINASGKENNPIGKMDVSFYILRINKTVELDNMLTK